MPIDSVSSARPSPRSASNSARSARCGARCASKSAGRLGNRHQAAQAQPRQRGDGARDVGDLAPARAPLLLASPLMLTCRQTGSGGRLAGRCALSRSAIFSRSTECTQSKCSATTRVLLLCSGPIRCHSSAARRSASASILASAFLHVVLAEAALAGGVRLAHRVGAEGLAHREQRDALHGASGGRHSACNARVHTGRACLRSLRLALRLRAAPRLLPPRSEHALPEEPWTSPNCWRSRSRTRPPTCTCRPACRR